MFNEKMRMSKQTILNWLSEGSRFLEGSLKSIKKKLLQKGTTLYCDETWVDTKVKDANGEIHYRKRYMWVLVNLTTKVCYYLFGKRKREVIEVPCRFPRFFNDGCLCRLQVPQQSG